MGYPNTPAVFDSAVWASGARLMALSPNGHAGPASYVTSATTGDVLQAAEFGLKWLERVFGGITADGLYEIKPVNPVSGPVTTVKLIWIDLTSGLEVGAGTDLHLSIVNLFVLGR